MTSTPQRLPVCAEPQRDTWLQGLVEDSVEFLVRALRDWTVDAVLLTGSAARGEASVLPLDGRYRLLGDIEFLVVVQPPIKWPALRRRMLELSRQATWELGDQGRRASIEYGPAGLIYLSRNIRPSIFAYDLRSHARVVWGRHDILAEIPSFKVGDIPAEDAINLLMNRLIETLIWEYPLPQSGAIEAYKRAYHQIKVALDLAGSALAFTGRYVSRYAERAHAFRALLDAEPRLATILPEADRFLVTLERAVRCKLEPTSADIQAYLSSDITHLQTTVGRALWAWEVGQLYGLTRARFTDAVEVYASRETLARRLRGWLKFLLHPLRPPQALSWRYLLRLLPHASPQTLTYAAAMLALAGLNGDAGTDWQRRVVSLVPIPLSPSQAGQIPRDIGDLWQWLIRNN